jgi:type VI secretion system secreted protein Hcp
MAVGDMFLEFSGKGSFKGESQDKQFKDTIQILSYSLGAQNAGSGAYGGGSGSSKVSMSDVSITKIGDKSSPLFFQSCAAGTHIDKAIIHVREAGDDPQEYLTIEFNEVLISGFSHSCHNEGGKPQESATLNFSSYTMKYRPQKADGTLEAGSPIGWHLKENHKI